MSRINFKELEQSEEFQRSWQAYFHWKEIYERESKQKLLQSKQDTLLKITSLRFDAVPEYVEGYVKGVDDGDMLDQLIEKIVLADSVEDVFPPEI